MAGERERGGEVDRGGRLALRRRGAGDEDRARPASPAARHRQRGAQRPVGLDGAGESWLGAQRPALRARRSRGTRASSGSRSSSRSCSSRRSRGSSICEANAPTMPSRGRRSAGDDAQHRPGRDRRGRQVGRGLDADRRVGAAAQRLQLAICSSSAGRAAMSGGCRRRRGGRAGAGSLVERVQLARCGRSTIAFAKPLARSARPSRVERLAVMATMLLCATGSAVTWSSRARGVRAVSESLFTRSATRRRSRAATRSRRRASGRWTRGRAGGRRALRCRVVTGVTSRSASASYDLVGGAHIDDRGADADDDARDDHPHALAQHPHVPLERKRLRARMQPVGGAAVIGCARAAASAAR